jgi:hypothetical protein
MVNTGSKLGYAVTKNKRSFSLTKISDIAGLFNQILPGFITA